MPNRFQVLLLSSLVALSFSLQRCASSQGLPRTPQNTARLSNLEDLPKHLRLPPSLAGKDRAVCRWVHDANAIVAGFAHQHDLAQHMRIFFEHGVEIYDTQAELWQRVLSIHNLPKDRPLPTKGLSAGLEGGVLLAVSPREYKHIVPRYASQENAYVRLLAHEIAHRLHIAVLDGNEEAMGAQWFYEGFATVAAGQFHSPDLDSKTAWKATRAKGPGSYEKYAAALRYFARRIPLPLLVAKAGNSTFEKWLRRVEAYRNEFDFIADKIERVYSCLDIKQKRYGFDYGTVKRTHQREVIEADDDAAFYQVLIDFLATFKDGHLRLKLRTTPGRSGKLDPAVVHRWLPKEILVTKIARLWGNEAEIRSGLNDGVKRLRRARALIVDLRGNGGGNDQIIFDYISKIVAKEIPLGRFSLRMSREVMAERPHYAKIYQPDPARVGFSKWTTLSVSPKTQRSFRGPIAVLIDKACYSSCEGAALAFKNSGLARLYGQNTGGGSANPIFIDLPVSPGQLMIPIWIQIMPDGDPLEDNGVPPDVRLSSGQDSLATAIADIQRRLRKVRRQ